MKICCIAILLLSTGCATVWKRPGEKILVESTPSGADAAIQCAGDVRGNGVTPTRITIPRRANGCALSISKQGFATRVVPLERGYNPAFWSNFATLPAITVGLFLGGAGGDDSVAAAGLATLIGFAVDRSNGRGYRHFPDEINEKLEPVK
jgi:hypothetical protein